MDLGGFGGCCDILQNLSLYQNILKVFANPDSVTDWLSDCACVLDGGKKRQTRREGETDKAILGVGLISFTLFGSTYV